MYLDEKHGLFAAASQPLAKFASKKLFSGFHFLHINKKNFPFQLVIKSYKQSSKHELKHYLNLKHDYN